MQVIILLLLAGAVFGDILKECGPLPEGEIDVTNELEEAVSAKLAEAFHRLALQPDGIPLVLLHILRISRRIEAEYLNIVATIGPKPETCTLVLRELAHSQNQRLDINCGERKWLVIRDELTESA